MTPVHDSEEPTMNAIPYAAPEGELEPSTFVLPGRPRRRLGGLPAAGLLAAAVGAACFYAGVRVEKSQVSVSAGSTAGLAARARGLGAGGFPRAFASGTGGAGGNASFGTVASVAGRSFYLTDASGNTVKVTLSSATTITKSESVSRRSVRPGDTVIVAGLKGSDGTISATSVTDSGARGGASTAGGSTTGTSGAGAAVNSLFGSGGG
jgi:hypothetical protein